MPVDATHAMCRRIPPLFGQQEGLLPETERPFPPRRINEASVLCRWLHQHLLMVRCGLQARAHVLTQRLGLRAGQLRQRHLLAGRVGQVHSPVLPGQQRRGRREPARGSGQQGVGLRVKTIRQRRAWQ